jgi:hypothetical protein
MSSAIEQPAADRLGDPLRRPCLLEYVTNIVIRFTSPTYDHAGRRLSGVGRPGLDGTAVRAVAGPPPVPERPWVAILLALARGTPGGPPDGVPSALGAARARAYG